MVITFFVSQFSCQDVLKMHYAVLNNTLLISLAYFTLFKNQNPIMCFKFINQKYMIRFYSELRCN